MTEPTPTDRERVAFDLCNISMRNCGGCRCKRDYLPGADYEVCPSSLAIADRAIALGAKPPVDPVETLAKEVGAMVDNWCVDAQIGTDESVWKLGDRILRHILDRAKEMGL